MSSHAKNEPRPALTGGLPARPRLRQLAAWSLVVGAIGGGASVAGEKLAPEEFYPAYLVTFMFLCGIALGGMALTMLHCLTGGAWGLVIRRFLESAAATLPAMAILFLPLAIDPARTYVWARPETVPMTSVLDFKARYLNVEWFQIRAGVYFAIWIALSQFFNRRSLARDAVDQLRRNRVLARLAGPGLILYGLSVTFASVDWVMSLEPHWFSTVYGVLFMGGQALSALSFAILAAVAMSAHWPWKTVVSVERWHDLGNLLLAFVMFWSYVAFMQYLIIWYGNLPEENVWYLHRTGPGWNWIPLFLMAVHFALPFVLLLSRDVKRRAARLAAVAGLILVCRVVDLSWLIMPAFHPEGIHLYWFSVSTLVSVATFVGMGGLWTAIFAWNLSNRAEWPIYQDELEEELHEQVQLASK